MLTFMLLTLDKKLNQNQMISIGLLFSWILVFFIDSPSPDLPIILFSFLAFSIYYNQLKSYYWFAILLLISGVFIKITLAPLLILLLFLMRKKRNIFYTLFFASLCASLWIFKNLFISGYPFYPLNIQFSEVDWAMNKKIFLHFLDFSSTQNFELNLDQLFFYGAFIVLFIILVFSFFKKWVNELKIILIIILLHFVFLMMTSPQIRFIIPDLMIILSIFISKFFQKSIILKIGLIANGLIILFLLKTPNFSFLDQSKMINSDKRKINFSLLEPAPNSQFYSLGTDNHTIGNLEYSSPPKSKFFFNTGDGPLPTSSHRMLEYFHQQYNVFPQLRTNDLKDGFRAKSTKK